MPSEGEKMAFVTVGSTSFPELIATVDSRSFRDLLLAQGFTRLVLQYGRGPRPSVLETASHALQVEAFDFSPSIQGYMDTAALVLSHGGSGSILEALRAEARLVVVINRSLMHDHQTQIAEKFHQHNHLLYTDCAGLETVVADRKWEHTAPFPQAPVESPLLAYLDSFMGF